jgi:hypothetical protein
VFLSVVVMLTLEHVTFTFVLGLHDYEISAMSRVYQYISRFGVADSEPAHTAILEVESVDGGSDVGAKEQALIDLFPKVLELHPDVIAVDLTLPDYRTNRYASYDEITAQLLKSVHAACSKTAVVFGFDIQADHILPYIPTSQGDTLRDCYDGFRNADNPWNDFRLIPVSFQVGNQRYRSFSYAAARAGSSGLAHRIQPVWDSEDPVYGLLYSLTDYRDRYVRAHDVLFSSLSEAAKGNLEHSILVIGFGGGRRFKTPAGELPGYLLQASYIEALVAPHFFRQLPEAFEILAAIGFYCFVWWRPERLGQLKRIGIGLVVLVFIDMLLVAFTRRYSDFALISLSGVAIWCFHHLHLFLDEHLAI